MPEDLFAWLSEQGSSVNQAIVDLLENARIARLYSLNELKDRFTPDEWKFFADSLNGTLVNDQFRYNKGVLIAHCEDSESLEGAVSRHGVDIEILKKKINAMSASQVEALYCRVEQFCNTPTDLDKWSEY